MIINQQRDQVQDHYSEVGEHHVGVNRLHDRDDDALAIAQFGARAPVQCGEGSKERQGHQGQYKGRAAQRTHEQKYWKAKDWHRAVDETERSVLPEIDRHRGPDAVNADSGAENCCESKKDSPDDSSNRHAWGLERGFQRAASFSRMAAATAACP